jgi:hypothetical protein
MTNRNGLLGLAMMLMVSPVAWAHPGHGVSAHSESLAHYLFSPHHLLPFILFALTLVAFLIVSAKCRSIVLFAKRVKARQAIPRSEQPSASRSHENADASR